MTCKLVMTVLLFFYFGHREGVIKKSIVNTLDTALGTAVLPWRSLAYPPPPLGISWLCAIYLPEKNMTE